ncbi:MAG: flagellar assembly peptidoglycan hydrolase FlgJ [Betaproteobacteria bacterium]|nr:flagellar assembly peptidoglycan hydrolase FlgJ [Betaproteobacteria bacterium]
MIQTNDVSGRLALDARGLDALRLQAKRNPEQAAKGVAQQFEAVFLHTLLKSMRDATPQDGPMDSDQTRAYSSMLDQQMAQTLSVKGIGLADVMLRQLTRNRTAAVGGEPAPQPPEANAPAAAAAPAPRATAGEIKAERLRRGQDFLARMKDHALEASDASGIPARFLLGQAALESGWGKHEIRAANGSQSFNLFGIKAGSNWKGPTVDATTTEYVDGAPRKMLQKFRAYASYADAFKDYAALMQGNRRYAAVLKQSDNAGFAQALQRTGYATDPRYADKLTSILNGARMRRTIVA